ncbi:septum formation initiator family protein [Bifidobacterium sp. ESL0690]|uniref:FtsB family cell division protein n=1 Tax=Bifidobacterium sp. ESL0690 TaxID=2983214 RepID=UPI0023F8F0E8|nr:septum formation initiator family protein [Bifidobacterium sp. ESL0690]WEV47400.1 septum formation initiator family protein [Bifidobacterium sp. ESL0690]
MGTTKSKGKGKAEGDKKRGGSRGSGPIAFFIAVFIVALGAIQLVATFHSYALNLAELNGLKRQEAALVSQKQNLENDISRWNDNAYVTAQARERLGFVFPGEQAIHVEHPEAVTGVKPKSDNTDQDDVSSDKPALPWYRELAYGFKKADEPLKKNKSGEVTTPKAVGGQSDSDPDAGGTPNADDNTNQTGNANHAGNNDKKNAVNPQNKGQKAGAGSGSQSGGSGKK